MPTTHVARSSPVRTRRRVSAFVVALSALLMPATAYAAGTTSTAAPVTEGTGAVGTDADFCLDTPPGVQVNEYNCPVAGATTTTTSRAPSRPRTTTPRVKANPRYTG